MMQRGNRVILTINQICRPHISTRLIIRCLVCAPQGRSVFTKQMSIQPGRSLSTISSGMPSNKGWLHGLRNFWRSWSFGLGMMTIAGAQSLFSSCRIQTSNAGWQQYGLVGSDFRSKQLLLVVHVWLIHKRLLKEGKRGLKIQEALFDELWEDTTNRIRGQGVNELSVNKYLKEVQNYSFRCCLELDFAISLTRPDAHTLPNAPKDRNLPLNEEDVIDEISGVLWRSVYLRNSDVPEHVVVELAKYIRREYLSVQELKPQAILEGRMQFGELPKSWSKHANSKQVEKAAGEVIEEVVEEDEANELQRSDGLSDASAKPMAVKVKVWREATAPDGRIYYYNIESGEARWDKPEGRGTTKMSLKGSTASNQT